MPNRHTGLLWDLPVRLVHWLLVVAVLGSYVTAQLGTKLFRWHRYCGYTILVLVTFRIVWGFVGTRYARFEQFMRSPRRTFQYAVSHAEAGDFVGHNPLGGWAIVAMLLLLFGQAITGLFATDDISRVGPFAGSVSSPLGATLTKLHHLNFDALAILIFLHATAVAYHTLVGKQNLLTPMITGIRRSTLDQEFDDIQSSRIVLALLIVAALAVALAVALFLAPPISMALF